MLMSKPMMCGMPIKGVIYKVVDPDTEDPDTEKSSVLIRLGNYESNRYT